MHVRKRLKIAALAGLVGLSLAAIATPARADTRCDGERCWRVVCDRDGDRCRRQPIHTGWYGTPYRGERYYDGDRERFYRYHHFDHRRGVWICDGSSEYCRWSARRW